ncbi:tartrate dehydrogenase [Marivita hallyeonensis]|uniref:D-malate dehydrogenase [decarboxylating] n=1 Tax=Marivita hallyeonensis TaxID=996342 RepID=A0A1M5W392_9RHOB|nr:tartrate dehydrogenase [Marivita hallyeonensis]SHH81918.1 tartrate dehydrogenase/decarboxylase / D-malate dehydrogenase [Marivita hallyeonensis]
MNHRRHRIATIPGDGIGHEVIEAGQEVLEAAARKFGFSLNWTEFDWSCDRFQNTGQMMPEDGIDLVREYDAIYLGAVGWPTVPDHVSLWGLLIPLRRELDLYANVRPVKLFEGVKCPLADRKPEDIDFVVVRENVEGEYSKIGGRLYEGTPQEAANQVAMFTRHGTDRIMEVAFDLAKRRRKHVTSATKSNGIVHTMPFWDERFKAATARHAGVETAAYHIDILAAHFVLHPDWFDVVVASNLFGDILSDLGPAVAGSIGIAPSANLNPARKTPSMFEPVHGSAPDIAGKGIANPAAAIWAGAMMLEHLGETQAAEAVINAMATTLAQNETRTADLGGTEDTRQSVAAVLAAL